MQTSSQSVKLNVYDLSNGMAKQFSPMFLRKTIDGIWHTGIIVYGREYYYGGGICYDYPSSTPYGRPVQTIDLGTTSKSQDEFHAFLQTIKQKFSMENYSLLTNNCNNFTDECSHFLINQGIPSHITGLPSEVINTPLGQMFKPIIDQMENSMKQQGQASVFPQAFEGGQSGNQFGVQSQQDFNPTEQYFHNIQDKPYIINGFFLSNEENNYNQFQQLKNVYANLFPQLIFSSYLIESSNDLFEILDVQEMPTYILYSKSDEIERIIGDNSQKLVSAIKKLQSEVFTQNPSQQQQNIGTNQSHLQTISNQFQNEVNAQQQVTSQKNQPQYFNIDQTNLITISSKIDMPIKKLSQILSANDSLKQREGAEIIINWTQKNLTIQNLTTDQQAHIISILDDIIQEYSTKVDCVIPVLDLLKELLITSPIAINSLTNQKGQNLQKFILQNLEIFDQAKPIKIVLQRVIINYFKLSESRKFLNTIIDKFIIFLKNFMDKNIADRTLVQNIAIILYNIIVSQKKHDEIKLNESQQVELLTTLLSLLQQKDQTTSQYILDDSQKIHCIISLIILLGMSENNKEKCKTQSVDKLLQTLKATTNSDLVYLIDDALIFFQ